MIIFHNVKWINFLSTGNVWTEIKLDRNPTTLIVGENGSGKSTLLDALCFGLFNRPFRKINKPQLINSVNDKGMVVEVEFSIAKNKYKIIRGMKPNCFEIYLNNVIMNQTASIKDYQDHLEKNILKLNFTSFTQIVILGSSTFVPFMQLPASSRREIIEDLLDIKIFSFMNVLLKEKINTAKEKIKDIRYKISFEQEKLEVHKKYIKNIQTKNKERIDQLKLEISKSETSISRLNLEIEANQKLTDELTEKVKDEKDTHIKIQKILNVENKLLDKIKNVKREIKFYEDNNTCPTCTQEINETIKSNKINNSTIKLVEIEKGIDELQKELVKENERITEINEINKNIQLYLTQISSCNNQIYSLNKYILQLNVQVKNEIIENTDISKETKLVDNIRTLIYNLENNREKYINESNLFEVAADFLKDKGIKTQIVRQYVPVMNKLINKYLAAMEFFVSFELDENFNEKIKSRHRDEFSYGSFSEGEKMRIDLALLLTWRAIAKMKNSANTNLLILDEVFDASLDANGCDEFLKLLNELGKETNVYVISHKGDILQDKFRSVIRFEKQKNFSKMI